MKCEDDKSFLWCILTNVYPKSRSGCQWHNYVQYIDEVNFTGMTFPVKVNQIDLFESQNKMYSVNVFGYNESEKKVYSIRLSETKRKHHTNLLLLNGELEHYALIKNMQSLLQHTIKDRRFRYLCAYCAKPFIYQAPYNNHVTHVHFC